MNPARSRNQVPILIAAAIAASPMACGKKRPFGTLEGGPDTSTLLEDGGAASSPDQAAAGAPDDGDSQPSNETYQPEDFDRTSDNAASSDAEFGPCEDGAVQACGPDAENGPCRFGSRACISGVWGECVGAVLAGERDCGSAEDNNCDGAPDDAIDDFCQCAVDSVEPCEEHPDSDGRGPCQAGSRTCLLDSSTGGTQWGPCVGSVAPLASDSCEIAGDDGNCNGIPNDTCRCVNGQTIACGPRSNEGICEFGVSECVGSAFTECAGAVFPRRRDCTSELDNDCDGAPDNAVDNVCACVVGDFQACSTHPGRDGNGICRAGTRVCVLGANGTTSQFDPCEGSIGPAPTDSCTVRGDDSNCDGVANGNCECIAGERTTCGQEYGSLGVCSARTLVCNNSGRWPAASTCAPASEEICSNALDDDCDGVVNEPDACDDCSETCFCEGGSCAELVDIDTRVLTTCVLTARGNVWCWGRNNAGQIGVSGFQNELRPRRANQVAGVRDVVVGTQFACALQADQTVMCWGSNRSGQLGDNRNVEISVSPVQVIDDSNAALGGVSKIVAGTSFACALRSSDGSVFCWGDIVGDGQTEGSPVAVATRRSANAVLVGVGAIEAGNSFAIARTGAGWLSWGGTGGPVGLGQGDDVFVSAFAGSILDQPNPTWEQIRWNG